MLISADEILAFHPPVSLNASQPRNGLLYRAHKSLPVTAWGHRPLLTPSLSPPLTIPQLVIELSVTARGSVKDSRVETPE